MPLFPADIDRRSTVRMLLEFMLIVILFFVCAGGRPPAVNEAHYLTRAKHFWNPGWCAGDVFLESRETHVTFVFLMGWITRFCSLTTTAWIGRLLAWSLLATGWMYLTRTVSRRPGVALLSAALAAVLWGCFHMAGEWVVGGLEAKVFAYGLVLWAMGTMMRGQWQWTWPLLGGATALHAVVGGWAVFAAAVVFLREESEQRPSPWRLWGSIIAATIVGLAGVLPVLWMNADVELDQRLAAYQVQVFRRLPHHLCLLGFHPLLISRHLMLWCAWLWMISTAPVDRRLTRLRRFVGVSIGLAIAGTVLSVLSIWHPSAAARLLRFYWFRSADVMVAVGIAVTAAAWCDRPLAESARMSRAGRTYALAALLLFVTGGVTAIFLVDKRDPLPAADRQSGITRARRASERVRRYRDWRHLCSWVHEYTPASALVLTPIRGQTFKWYAHRPELVNWKDMPQDARSLTAWWQRLQDVEMTGLFDPERTTDEYALKRLTQHYHVAFLVTPRQSTPLHMFPLVFRNGSFEVYRVPDFSH